MAVCAQGLEVCRIIVSVIPVAVIYIKLASMHWNKPTLLAYWTLMAHILSAMGSYRLLNTKALTVAARTKGPVYGLTFDIEALAHLHTAATEDTNSSHIHWFWLAEVCHLTLFIKEEGCHGFLRNTPCRAVCLGRIRPAGRPALRRRRSGRRQPWRRPRPSSSARAPSARRRGRPCGAGCGTS